MRVDESAPASRVLIYSHDTFGLGHLRRADNNPSCRADNV